MSCLKCSNFLDIGEEERVRDYSLLQSLSIDSPTNNIHHLTDIDADINMPFDNNFAYYTPHDFHNNFDISQCFSNNQSFSIINCNIRSLSTNFDSLTNMLSNLYFSFSLIGLTETKIKSDQTQIVNIDLPGYQFLSQPTLSDWGGVAFYIKDNCILKLVLTYHLPLKTLRHYGLKSRIILIPIYFVASFFVTRIVILEILLII